MKKQVLFLLASTLFALTTTNVVNAEREKCSIQEKKITIQLEFPDGPGYYTFVCLKKGVDPWEVTKYFSEIYKIKKVSKNTFHIKGAGFCGVEPKGDVCLW